MITIITTVLGILVQVKNLLPASVLKMLGLGGSSTSTIAAADKAVEGVTKTETKMAQVASTGMDQTQAEKLLKEGKF